MIKAGAREIAEKRMLEVINQECLISLFSWDGLRLIPN